MNTSSFLASCVFIVYVMFDKNTILKIKYLLNYFQTGHLIDASGKRTIFSSRSFVKPPTVGEEYFRQQKCLLLYIYYTVGKKMSQQEK